MKEIVPNYRWLVGEDAYVQSLYFAILSKCDDDMVAVKIPISVWSDCGILNREDYMIDSEEIDSALKRLVEIGVIERIDNDSQQSSQASYKVIIK